MKKLNLLLILFLSTLLVQSCTGESDENSEEGSITEEDASGLGEGPDYEVNVLSFDIDERVTVIEVLNRSDYDIKEIKGELCFQDSTGEQLTNLFGSPKTSNFQKIKNPTLVKSGERTEIETGNRIPKKTGRIEACNLVLVTTEGEEIKLE